MPAVLHQIKELESHDPAPAEAVTESSRIVTEVINRKAPLSSSVLTSILGGICRRVCTTAIDTMAVTLAGDGIPMLLFNPHFTIKLGEDGALKVLFHEVYHLLGRHLYADPELHRNPNWTLATEACINYRMTQILNCQLPTVDGEETGINPDKIFKSYKDNLKKQGIEPVAKMDDLYRTDLGCFAELERMTKPPRQKGGNACLHGTPGDPGTGAPGQPGDSPVHLDQDEVDKMVGKAIDAALHDATANGNKAAKEELIKLMDASADSERASKIWGDHGAGALRGQVTGSRKTDLWHKWTEDAIATRMEDSNRWIYARKIWWDPQVRARGRRPRKQGVVAVDTSGSMSDKVLNAVSDIISDTPGLDVEWIAFDGKVWPFKIGERFSGGGGTNFGVVSEYVNDMDEEPDFVLMVTDGYAAHITPQYPERWIWLITEGGDPWPESMGMSTRVVDTEALQAG